MSSTGEGGPAFPVLSQRGHTHEGMSLRDYFAAKAMEVLVASGPELAPDATASSVFEGVAIDAYAYADAMLHARIKEPVEICGNCDTELPGGCGGLFRDEPSCRFASAEVKP